MFGLGFQEILLILFILFLLFGAKKLPEIGKGLGETMKEIGKIRGDRKGGKKKTKRTKREILFQV
jgi:sec-independent protein translocase protein TatA